MVCVLPTINVTISLFIKMLLLCPSMIMDNLKAEWLIDSSSQITSTVKLIARQESRIGDCRQPGIPTAVERIHVCTTPNLSWVKRRTKKSTKRPTCEKQASHHTAFLVLQTLPRKGHTTFPHCIYGSWSQAPALPTSMVGECTFVSHSGSPGDPAPAWPHRPPKNRRGGYIDSERRVRPRGVKKKMGDRGRPSVIRAQ